MAATVKNIYLTCEDGAEALMPMVQEAISEVMACFPEYQPHFPVTTLANWKENNYRTVRNGHIVLEPYKSIDWYIRRARDKSEQQGRWRPGREQLSIDQLCQDLEADPYSKKIPQYSLLITTHDLYGTLSNGQLLNFCNGVTHEGKFAIISASRFVEGGVLDVERFKTVVMHEFGHLIGLTPNGRRNSYQQLGTHCSNGDIMEQDMSGTGRAMTINRLERKRRGLPPICTDCVAAGKEFFNREIQKHNAKYRSSGRDGYE